MSAYVCYQREKHETLVQLRVKLLPMFYTISVLCELSNYANENCISDEY